MAGKKIDHSVQVLMHGYRYVATEQNGTVTVSRDGDVIGKARWKDDQLLSSSAVVPDDVCHALEKKLKEQMDRNWGED